MSPSMGHTDTLTEIALDGRNGGFLLRFDPTRNEVSLHTAEHADGPGQRLALLTGATDEVHALAASRIPAGLTLPSVDLDRTWHLVFFPLDGTVVLHGPFGDKVGGLLGTAGFAFINALRDALA